MQQPQTSEVDAEVSCEKCYICLGPFEEQSVGSLEKCQHQFCLECIVQWSKTSNTCPVDRTDFTEIQQRRRIGGAIQKKIKVTPPRQEPDEQSLAVICENCGRSDRRNTMLLCSHCDSGFHMNCLRPAVTQLPEGLWVCPECEVVQNQPESFAAAEGISDGELEDILSDADETTSRFRPSTHNSRSTRHSDRVQTRSNRDLTAPQAITQVPKYLLQPSSLDATTCLTPSGSTSVSDDTAQRNKRKHETH
ncbi:unnamed protein product [Knipowitschia caucasica]|uniref:PHD and RING finger domain-containing protein 1 n=1 Tax=Knipowitschia caucasica TaxID=637954 RepID=A0AAV2LZ75_KNICA